MQEQINSQSMLKVGTILRGIYRIESYLSSGGFGNTYVATNIEFDERVAIKEFFMKGVTQRDGNETTVSVSNAENQDSFLEQREKFKKEARRLRRLNNPHIVSVHDLFEEHGTAYYVMDYVDGENLAERLKRTGKPMTEAEVNEILPQILDALKSVHDAGIWHLDLKPANIMVDKSGQVKLIDFGASKQLNAQKGGATTSTAISYTNGYAPREQMEQNYDKFGPWTDIYALGATLYNLLTSKQPPFPTDIDDDKNEDKHVALPFPESVSDDMKHCILWMMNTDYTQRPQSANAIILDYSEETIIARLPSDTENTLHSNTYDTPLIMCLPTKVYIIAILFIAGCAGILIDIAHLVLAKLNLFDNHPIISAICMCGIGGLSLLCAYRLAGFVINHIPEAVIREAEYRRDYLDSIPPRIVAISSVIYIMLLLVFLMTMLVSADGNMIMSYGHPMAFVGMIFPEFPLMGGTVNAIIVGFWVAGANQFLIFASKIWLDDE